MLGIAGVAVATEARGGGVARWMMGECLREAAADGFALSCLYASTHALYRQVGYEEAGVRQVTRIPVQRLDVRAREPGVRALGDADAPGVEACYRAFASRYNGTPDRGEYLWGRVRDFRGKRYDGFGVESPDRPGALEGYVYLRQDRRDDGTQVAAVSDLAFTTPRAGRRLLALLADLGTMVHEATLGGAPWPPVLSLGQAHRFDVAKTEQWMLRICDVRRALEERGYPRHVAAEIVLNVHDPVVRANEGAWTFTVGHGRARAVKEATVRPALTLSINALAAIYSGFYTARQAALLGWAEGNDAALEAADAVFGGFGTPWMTDFF
jgi:predicted acetyltransferase